MSYIFRLTHSPFSLMKIIKNNHDNIFLILEQKYYQI
jgi:hypothetical protein